MFHQEVWTSQNSLELLRAYSGSTRHPWGTPVAIGPGLELVGLDSLLKIVGESVWSWKKTAYDIAKY